ncbi:MAG: hypothetical protein KAH97_08565 [Anaerolineales bacterium]|nr:hypothetical protein [Anaerolineales bacterium]
MKIGMLWFDDSSRAMKIKVKDAVDFYVEKYGQAPTHCYVNPSMLSDKTKPSNGVEVKESRTVMPHHFWLGIGKVKTTSRNGRSKAAPKQA